MADFRGANMQAAEAQDRLAVKNAEIDSLSARVKELEEDAEALTIAANLQRTRAEAAETRALRAEQQRDEAYERAAKICDAEFDRIISKQTPTDDPLSMADTVNTNIRMMACILPEVAAAIRRLAPGPEGGAT